MHSPIENTAGRLPKVALPSRAPASLSAGRAQLLLDFLAGALAWPTAATVLAGAWPGALLNQAVLLLLPPAAWILLLFALGLYRREALGNTRKALERATLAAGASALVVSAVATILSASVALPIPTSALFAGTTICFALCGVVSRLALLGLRWQGMLHRRIVIVGSGRRAWDLAWLLRREGRSLHYEIVFVHDPAYGELDPRLVSGEAGQVVAGTGDILGIVVGFGADQVVVAPDERRGLDMRALLSCKTAGFPVMEYLQLIEDEIGRVDIKRIELGWLLYSKGFNLGLLDRALKRALDIAVSAAVLLATGPFLLLAIVAVKIDDPGPAFYSQARVTRGGRVFRIVKLRTMRVDAERAGAVWAAERDPRITRIGRFLRRTRLDELPQLINVLRGDMSFVGPRPERPEFTNELAAKLPLYDERHLVKAGLTGWAQVNYPYGASLDDARSKLSYDLYYVKNFSVLFDLMIVLQTLRVVLWPGGVR
ncbi:TIGR03013 family XrtA/PEP-CTERM system glycosyltransferase [Belnapia moabensis]|uniref:TIGR03013 family XrtA/PEP-CTERM system glycosyltransferase n=1 Tax=Belnapia moabensis TaxID=365533 RepID=UPI001470088B|nr:TIGR03013 family XrtA/PEP-CTERM system glycosyltransferase [Belnapia moabensis]